MTEGNGESRQEAQRRLLLAIQETQAAYFRAVREQSAVIADMPTKLPGTDGVVLLQQKANARRMALQRYAAATQAFRAFMDTGQP